MRKIFMILMLTALTAFAGNLIRKSITSPIPAAGNLMPTSATVGIPIQINLSGSQNDLTAVVVNICDYSDGGVDDDLMRSAQLSAWKFTKEAVIPDGGLGWSRFPQLDVVFNDDGGLAGPCKTAFLPLPTDVTNLSEGQLYFSTSQVTADGGGSIVHRVILEGRY